MRAIPNRGLRLFVGSSSVPEARHHLIPAADQSHRRSPPRGRSRIYAFVAGRYSSTARLTSPPFGAGHNNSLDPGSIDSASVTPAFSSST